MIHVLSCVNDKYFYEKMGPWLERTSLLGKDIAVHVITIDFDVRDDLKTHYSNIDFRRIEKKNCPTINSNWCLQEGGWIQAFPEAGPKDTFVVIDGDALIQRDFDKSERNALSNWPDGAIGMNWNAGEGDTLTAEASRIWPVVPLQIIRSHWYPQGELACHNAGVIVSNMKTWKVFYQMYQDNLDRVKKYFSHIAHQQWLINWCANQYPLHVELLPQSFHTHGHYGLYPGVRLMPNGDACYGEKEFRDAPGTMSFVGVSEPYPTWVRHKINWNPYPA